MFRRNCMSAVMRRSLSSGPAAVTLSLCVKFLLTIHRGSQREQTERPSQMLNSLHASIVMIQQRQHMS